MTPHVSSHRINLARLIIGGRSELRITDLGCSRAHWREVLVSEFILIQLPTGTAEEVWTASHRTAEIAKAALDEHRSLRAAAFQRAKERRARWTLGRSIERKLSRAARAGLIQRGSP